MISMRLLNAFRLTRYLHVEFVVDDLGQAVAEERDGRPRRQRVVCS